jgi:L-asparaginase II
MLNDHVIVVETFRGTITECQFRGSVAVVDLRGRMVASAGNPNVVTTIRSTAKPFQIVPLLEHKDCASLSLTEAEIAVMVGSHNGEDVHVNTVREVMTKGAIPETALKCGVHPPFLFSVTERTMLDLRKPISPVQHNCSGNHVGMLLLSKLIGAPLESYQDPEQPVQRMITTTISEIFEVPQTELILATDGCCIPTYAVRLDRLAYAFARLGAAVNDHSHAKALGTVRTAMMSNPFLVAGTDRLETDLMLRCPVVAKIGAQGVYAVGIPANELGLAIKIESGSAEAAECLAVEILRELGVLTPDSLETLEKYRLRPILASDGAQVGGYRPAGPQVIAG